jgi:indole-3-acetate monooxygenase
MIRVDWRRYTLTDELHSAVERLRPILEATEEQAERDRRMPPAVVEALKESGLWRLASPAVVGGMEADPLLEFEVYEAISRISTAGCWTAFIGSIHTAWPLAYVHGDEAAQSIANSDPPVVAGQLAPLGRAEVVDGGLRVTGRYSWGSGINHATWVMGGALSEQETDGPPIMHVWVAPKEQVEVLDNWFVSGLSGTGSFDYAVNDLFVSDDYTFQFDPFRRSSVRRGGSRYAAPVLVQAVPAHSGLALGAAERAFDLIANTAATKRRQLTQGQTLADRGAFQRDLGVAFHRLSAARSYIADLLSQQPTVDWTDESVVAELTTRYTGALTYATEVAVSVAALAYKYSGGSAARLDNPLQRILRDLQVAQQHTATADTSYDATGQWAIARATSVQPDEIQSAVAARQP